MHESAELGGNLFDAAERAIKGLQLQRNSATDPTARVRVTWIADVIRELVRYAHDRDSALSAKVHECALLRARLECSEPKR